MKFTVFLKTTAIKQLLLGLPFLLGFNSISFFVSIALLFFYFVYTKKVHLFYLSIFLYKYGTPNLISIDLDFLNYLSLLFSIVYAVLFLFKSLSIKNNSVLVWVLLFYILINSLFFSLLPALSLYKGIGFIVHTIAIIYILNYYRESILNFLFEISFFLVLTSIFLPSSITLYSELSLHAGILNQSQAYGYLLTLTIPIQFLYYYHNQSKKWIIGLIILSVYFIILSKMRSALIVLFAMSLIVFIFSKFREFKIAYILTLIISSLSIIGLGSELINGIFSKRNEEIQLTSTEEMFNSRYQLIEPEMENFQRYPIFGIGFGIPSEITQNDFNINERWGVKYIPGTDIIISLPTEKGVVYTAILEELGIIGAFLFTLFFISLFNNFNFENLVFIVPVLILSIGEASLLSPNGIGFYALLILLIPISKSEINTSKKIPKITN